MGSKEKTLVYKMIFFLGYSVVSGFDIAIIIK